MIIVKDRRNCLFNAARPVTDTAWLKLHENDSIYCRHAFRLPLSPLVLTVLPLAAHIDSDATAVIKQRQMGEVRPIKWRGKK